MSPDHRVGHPTAARPNPAKVAGRGHLRRDGLHKYPDLAAVHVPFLADLLVHVANNVCGDGEAQPFAAARLRQDEGVQPITRRRHPPAGRRYCRG